MQVQVQLVHAEAGRRVVLASAYEGKTCLASALGEAASAEEAEDRARQRLAAVSPAAANSSLTHVPLQLAETATAETATASKPEQPVPQERGEPAAAPRVEANGPSAPEPIAETVQEPMPDPEDWSSELAQLELQLKRLGWSRDQESTYLLRAFGHGNRSRLTRYSDLLAYLRALENLSPGEDPASSSIPLRRSDLLVQSDQLLQQLQWTASQGRRLLESHFGRSSRQQLSDAQLLEFNMLLEGELLSGSALSSAG